MEGRRRGVRAWAAAIAAGGLLALCVMGAPRWRPRAVGASGSSLAPGDVSIATVRDPHAFESLLGDLLEVEEIQTPAGAARKVRIRIKPNLTASARLTIEAPRGAVWRRIEIPDSKLSLRRGGAAIVRDLELSRSAPASLRVGLEIEDDAGHVIMTVHRELAPDRANPVPLLFAPSSEATRVDLTSGRAAIIRRPPAPAPRVIRRRP